MNTKVEIILRGVRQKDIINYFMDIAHEKVSYNGDNVMKDVQINGHLWQVTIHQEEVAHLGSLKFPEVKLCITGEKQRVTQLVFDFQLEFLTAGG